uniref:ORF46b n=1 Tax=Pinus thunbergii TaxID=3350 RepID=Q32940_PINTH|nr:ORF46b [Pinus thunbergii]BAA04337.1 ORF46b [Pinus thunbergii]
MRNQLVRIDPNHTISGDYEMNHFPPPFFFFEKEQRDHSLQFIIKIN